MTPQLLLYCFRIFFSITYLKLNGYVISLRIKGFNIVHVLVHKLDIIAVILVIIPYEIEERPAGILVRTYGSFLEIFLCQCMIYILSEDKASLRGLYLSRSVKLSSLMSFTSCKSIRNRIRWKLWTIKRKRKIQR